MGGALAARPPECILYRAVGAERNRHGGVLHPRTCIIYRQRSDARVPPGHLHLGPPPSRCVVQQQLVAGVARHHHTSAHRAAGVLPSASPTAPAAAAEVAAPAVQERGRGDVCQVHESDAAGLGALGLPRARLRCKVPQAQLAALSANRQGGAVTAEGLRTW
jgi:hypothetical protein